MAGGRQMPQLRNVAVVVDVPLMLTVHHEPFSRTLRQIPAYMRHDGSVRCESAADHA